jgi:hypothetical protein
MMFLSIERVSLAAVTGGISTSAGQSAGKGTMHDYNGAVTRGNGYVPRKPNMPAWRQAVSGVLTAFTSAVGMGPAGATVLGRVARGSGTAADHMTTHP